MPRIIGRFFCGLPFYYRRIQLSHELGEKSGHTADQRSFDIDKRHWISLLRFESEIGRMEAKKTLN